MTKLRDIYLPLIILVTLFVPNSLAHVGLTFPPGRLLDLDFLDFARTRPPCGMPKGLLRTSIKAGSTVNITWHLAYPHRGGFRIELLDKNEKVIKKLSDPESKEPFKTGDPTAQWYSVKIPEEPCEDCTIRLLREANEWSKYGFWTCGDVSIVKATDYKENCFGRGKPNVNSDCSCDKGYWGPRCQYKDECNEDSDCGNNGKCVDILGTSLPRMQCFCAPGFHFHGQRCLQNKAELPKQENLELSSYNRRVLSDRVQLYYKILFDSSTPEDAKEIEFVLRVNGTSYIAIGWRPDSIDKECKTMPAIEELQSLQGKRREARSKPYKSNPTLLEPRDVYMPEKMRAELDKRSSKYTGDIKKMVPILKKEPSTEPISEPESTGEPQPEHEPSKSEPQSEVEPSNEPQAEVEPEKGPSSNPQPEVEPQAEPEPSKVFPEPEPISKKTLDEVSPYKLERKPSKYAPAGSLHTMDCSDIVVGTAVGLYSRIRDYYTRDRSTPKLDTYYGGKEDITSAVGWEQNGFTTIIFRRKVKTDDPADHALSGTMQVIWARGQEQGEYVHNPSSGLETEVPSVPNFYSKDELKYHGHSYQRGVLYLDFPFSP